MDLVFASIIAIAFVHLMKVTRAGYFIGDDWPLALQSSSLRGFIEPYNDHLSLTILATYRALIEVFGFDYGPFRTMGLICLLAVPASFYLTTRRALGPPLAAGAALSLMTFSNVEVRPATLNHYLVLVGAIICAWALNRGRRADWLLAGGLLLAVTSAAGGVAVALAVLVHNACARPPFRRWLAALGPCVLWGAWWLLEARGNESRFRRLPGRSEALGYARDIASAPFVHLGFGNAVVGGLFAVAFVAFGVWRLRQGLDAAANFVAWTTAFVVWCLAVASSRGKLAFVEADPAMAVNFRYQLVALGFILLALVPRKPIAWPERFPLGTDPAWLATAAGVLLIAAASAGLLIRDTVDAGAYRFVEAARATRAMVSELDVDRAGIPDDEVLKGTRFLDVHAGEVRYLVDRYGREVDPTAPGAPRAPTAIPGDGEAVVSWSPPVSRGEVPITGYIVTPYIGYVAIPTQSFGADSTTQTIVGLTNGTSYRFTVKAVNAMGTGRESAGSNAVTPTAP